MVLVQSTRPSAPPRSSARRLGQFFAGGVPFASVLQRGDPGEVE
jgi:hypothetical protein